MRTLSVVHVTTFLQGGAGRAIVGLACAQQRAGHEVLVVTSATGVGGYDNYPHYLDWLRTENVELVREDSLFTRDLRLNLRVLERLRELRSADAVDVIHAHAAIPAIVGRLFAGHARRRMAVVQTQHGWGVAKTAGQAKADLAVLHDVDRVIVTSEASATSLCGLGVPRTRIAVIPCGLPAAPPPAPPAEARRCLEALRAGRRIVIGCVGSVTANKNQRLVLETLSRMSGRDVAAVFIGEGGESLTETAKILAVEDYIAAVGYRADAESWIGCFDLLVVPSLTEGQGLVVLEGFRAGVPVIASDIPPLRELVVDGKTGWLFDLQRPDALANAIRRAMAAPAHVRERIVLAARDRLLEAYTTDLMVARHQRLYDELCDDVA